MGADRVRTGRPVGCEQSDLFTQCEEINKDFRVSGLHMQLRNKPNISVFANSWRRSRIILIDKLFKPICKKVMPTTHLVKNQRRWFVTLSNVELFWVLRNNSKSAMLRILLCWNQGIVYCICGHLLRENKIQPTSSPMAIGYSLNPEICHQEGATSWQSSW